MNFFTVECVSKALSDYNIANVLLIRMWALNVSLHVNLRKTDYFIDDKLSTTIQELLVFVMVSSHNIVFWVIAHLYQPSTTIFIVTDWSRGECSPNLCRSFCHVLLDYLQFEPLGLIKRLDRQPSAHGRERIMIGSFGMAALKMAKFM